MYNVKNYKKNPNLYSAYIPHYSRWYFSSKYKYLNNRGFEMTSRKNEFKMKIIFLTHFAPK